MRPRRRVPPAAPVLVVLAAAAVLAACGVPPVGGTATGSGATARSLDPLEAGPARPGGVFVLAMATNNAFASDVAAGARAVAAEAAVELVVVDAADDPERQGEQLATAAAMGVQAVVVHAVDTGDPAGRLAPLVQAGVPVVALDVAIDSPAVVSLVASDHVDGGRQAAERLARLVGYDGTVLHLEGDAATSVSRDRGAGFAEGLADYPGVVVVARTPAGFDRDAALRVTTDLLLAHPEVAGIYAENDEMALGAIEALRERAGSDVQVVGFDAGGPGRGAVRTGTLAATVAVQPDELGAQAMAQAVAAAGGASPEPVVPIPIRLLDGTALQEDEAR